MTDNDTDSADDDRSLFAKLLRRSADELEQPDDGDADGDPNVEQRADGDEDDDGEMEETEQEANPIDTALESGTISAAEASAVRDVAERMDDGGVQTLIDAISENDLDVDDAVEMIEAYNGDDMAPPDGDGDGAPEELKARSDEDGSDADTDAATDDGLTEEDVAAFRAKLDSLDELGDRLDTIEQRLDDLPTEDDVQEQVEQRLEQVGEDLDEEFEDLIQRSEIVGSPNPKTGGTDGGPTVKESLGLTGGD